MHDGAAHERARDRIATRVAGALQTIDAGGVDRAAHVVVRHARGAPTPLVEDLATLEDAIAVARALHAPLGPDVALDAPA